MNIHPVAMTIAGSDSGGGAGIQADMQAFRDLDVFPTTAITAITSQNPRCVSAVHPVPPEHVTSQCRAVFDAFQVRAVKTGMLYSAPIIQAVAAAIPQGIPLVVDPVMIATSGSRLLLPEAVAALRSELFPRATLLTPNIPEAEALCDLKIRDKETQIRAALELAEQFKTAILVKGGHGDAATIDDILVEGGRVWSIRGPRIAAASTHGTGCRLSAAIAALLARQRPLKDAVRGAREYLTTALENCIRVSPDTHALWGPFEAKPQPDINIRQIG